MPFRQKGTGNARQGTNRAPHFSGGGVALGPHPRKYDQKTPKKMIRAALRGALSDRANEGGLRLVDSFALSAPKTKAALGVLAALHAEGRVLVVLSRDDEVTARSLSNLPHVVTLPGDQLTAFDVLCADVIIFTDETLPGGAGAGAPAASEKEDDGE
jgi:large subunit ribosomal protein L4